MYVNPAEGKTTGDSPNVIVSPKARYASYPCLHAYYNEMDLKRFVNGVRFRLGLAQQEAVARQLAARCLFKHGEQVTRGQPLLFLLRHIEENASLMQHDEAVAVA